MAVLSSKSPKSPPQSGTAHIVIRRIMTIAGLAVILGLAMQALILTAKLAGGGQFPGLQLMADMAQGVTWSVLVCTGVGVGAVAAKARAALMGALGLVCAPAALAVAKAAQKTVAALLEKAGKPAVLSLATVGSIKAIEYGLLGCLLGWMLEKQVSRPGPYLLAGAGIGIVFGGGLTVLTYRTAIENGLEFPMPQLFGTAVNEMVFPVGCALVIYLGQFLSRHLGRIGIQAPTTGGGG
jgi:hypothetical protein